MNFKRVERTVLMLLFTSFLSGLALAQSSGTNLVTNGSFDEEPKKKPKKLGAITSANGWYSPVMNQADLFMAEKDIPNTTGWKDDANVKHANIYGYEDPKSGKYFAGISAYSPAPDPTKAKVPRSYLLTKLNTPMKKGMKYCVKFYVSLGELSKYSCNNISAYFTKDENETTQFVEKGVKGAILKSANEQYINHPKNSVRTHSQTFGWEQVCGTYIAKGGEKFLMIGNFLSDKETKFETMKNTPTKSGVSGSQLVTAYYFIDDVSVILLENNDQCDCIVDETAGDEYSASVYLKEVLIREEMTPAERIEIQEVHFPIVKADLNSNGKEALDYIFEVMKANPGFKLEIQGHSDSAEVVIAETKPEFAGMDSKRIEVVYNYLTEKGIPKERLQTMPMGVEMPSKDVEASDDAELHTIKDLRVTFKVRQ
jgi:outer membrane protein OmpA-like peptidoglycan-associated protein